MSRLCLDCRTALGDDETRCPWHGDRVVSLVDPRDRDAALASVWVAKKSVTNVRDDLIGFAKIVGALAIGGAIAWALEVGMTTAVDLVVVACCAFAAVGLLVARPRGRGRALIPTGAALALRPSRGAKVCGVAREASGADRGGASGASRDGGPAGPLAFELALSVASRGAAGTTLVLARSRGFEVALDDGRTVVVPAGRVSVVVERPDARRAAELDVVRAAIRHLDPNRATDELPSGRDPIPWDEATIVTIVPGDEVVVYGELAPDASAEARAGGAGYRGTALARLVVLGVPTIGV